MRTYARVLSKCRCELRNVGLQQLLEPLGREVLQGRAVLHAGIVHQDLVRTGVLFEAVNSFPDFGTAALCADLVATKASVRLGLMLQLHCRPSNSPLLPLRLLSIDGRTSRLQLQ